jgi:hypothetical protein
MTKPARITKDMKIAVVKKTNPFAPDTLMFKRGQIVLSANGKTVASVVGKGKADAWIVRTLAKKGLIRVTAA